VPSEGKYKLELIDAVVCFKHMTKGCCIENMVSQLLAGGVHLKDPIYPHLATLMIKSEVKRKVKILS
jgi:hypothetical protein